MIFPSIALYYGDTYIWFLSETAMYFMHTQSRTRPLWFLLNKTQTESVLQWSFTCLIQSRETLCWKTTLKAGTPAVYCHLRQDAPRYGRNLLSKVSLLTKSCIAANKEGSYSIYCRKPLTKGKGTRSWIKLGKCRTLWGEREQAVSALRICTGLSLYNSSVLQY